MIQVALGIYLCVFFVTDVSRSVCAHLDYSSEETITATHHHDPHLNHSVSLENQTQDLNQIQVRLN